MTNRAAPITLSRPVLQGSFQAPVPMRSMESHDTSTDLGIRTDGMAGRVLLVDDLDANLKLLSSISS